jgi:hypothetical protein
MKQLIEYVLLNIQVPYILTGKIQTDNIESRFGHYHQLTEGNYNITVNQVLEAETKIRIKTLLELQSAQYGEIPF